MPKVVVKYQPDFNASILYSIIVDPIVTDFRSSANAANGPPINGTLLPISVYASANRSRFGIHARGVFIRYVNQGAGNQFDEGNVFVPILTRFRYRNLILGELVTYNGRTAMILGLRNEAIRS